MHSTGLKTYTALKLPFVSSLGPLADQPTSDALPVPVKFVLPGKGH